MSYRAVDPHSRFPTSSTRSSSAGGSATSSPSPCAAGRAPSRGSSTRGRRRPTAGPASTTCWPACSRTSTRATRRCGATGSSARAAGTATACRSRSRSSSSSGLTSQGRHRGATGSPSSTAAAASRCFEFLEDWNRLTERIGFWIDLDHAYRTLDDYLHRVGLVGAGTIYAKGLLYEGHKVVPYCPRCGTALSSHEVGQPGAIRTSSDPSVYVRLPVTRPGGPLQAGDELLIWTTTPWTLVANAAVAVDPDLPTSGRARTATVCVARRGARRAACWATAPRSSTASPARRSTASPTEPPFDFIPGAAYGERGHTVLLGRLRHRRRRHRPRPHGDRLRRGRLPPRRAARPAVVNPVRLDGTYDETDRPVRRALRQGRRRRPDRGPPRPRAPAARRAATSTPTRTAGAAARRSSTTPSRRGTSPRTPGPRPAAGGQRVGRLASRARQARPLRQLAGEQRRLGAVARALLGHAAADLALRRRPLTCIGSFAELDGAPARRSATPTGPSSTTSSFPCARVRRADAPGAGGDRRLVRLGVDAVRPAPRALRARGALRAALPGRLHLRGARPDARLVLLAARRVDAAVRPVALPQRRLPGPDPRRRGPEDVEVAGQHPRARGRSSTASGPTPCAGTSSPPRRRGTATGSRPRRSARRCGCSCSSSGTPTASSSCTPTPTARRRQPTIGSRARPTSTAGSSRAWRPPSAVVTDRLDAFDATGAGRAIAEFVDELSNWYVRRSRRRFWDGDPAAFATLHECLVTVAQLLAPFAPFLADEIYDNLDGGLPSVHLSRLPGGAGPRDVELESAMAAARETVRLGPGRPGQAKVRTSPAAARGGRRGQRPPSARRSIAWATSSATS